MSLLRVGKWKEPEEVVDVGLEALSNQRDFLGVFTVPFEPEIHFKVKIRKYVTYVKYAIFVKYVKYASSVNIHAELAVQERIYVVVGPG
jgi:hypothetical protein